MSGLDTLLADLGGASLALALVVAVLLGLRHATDPDHLTAVATLILGADDGPSRARRLGLAWGLGHGVTLFACGLPLVLFGSALPEAVHTAAELVIAALICLLALRLLARWRAGAFHAHEHSHGTRVHAHPHAHAPEHSAHSTHASGKAHQHRHEEAVGRTPAAAFGIGLVHGVGGSAGAGILLVGIAAQGGSAVLALALYAAGTALSMAFLSAGFGYALARGRLARHLEDAVPLMGSASLAFGLFYAFTALA